MTQCAGSVHLDKGTTMEIFEIDQPFGPFVSTGATRFRHASIEVAVVEVRLASGEGEFDEDAAAKMLGAFQVHGASRMEASIQRQVQFMINPAIGATQTQDAVLARGWQFSTEDRTCVFTVTPQAASVQVTNYERWRDSLKPQLETLLDVARSICGARVVERIGVRYINRLSAPPPDGTWTDVVAPALVGILSDPQLGSLIRNAHQQVELVLEPGIGVMLRHGPMFDGAGTGYLMDIDVHDSSARELLPEIVLARTQRLNRTAFSLFRALLSPKMLEEMDSIEDETEGVEAP